MYSKSSHIKCITTVLLISIHISTSVPAKPRPLTRPVIEIINEQARIDEPSRPPGFLPYGNPLAGNSKQNARLHAQNQQAMFNAERIRQHRAQIQRWTKAPQQEDSYMKAYHESQESHQIALEQQQTNTKDKATAASKLRPQIKRPPKAPKVEVTKITKADAIIKPERARNSRIGSRNHRSYGSILSLSQYLQPSLAKQSVYISPSTAYEQGVTIKPNGNAGLASLKSSPTQASKLYTTAIPSTTQYVYPKQYHQMQSYQSAYDIDTLNSLLNKNPNEQFSEFNALLKHQNEPSKETLTTPIDLYFYLKDNPETYGEDYDYTKYAHIKPNYHNVYEEPKDHKPITEEVDDIEDPNKNRPKPYASQQMSPAPTGETYALETTTTKNNNYYKVEVASQTISAPYNPKASYYYKDAAKPTHQVTYYQPYNQDIKEESDHSERYLHHNAQHKGIQHLGEDGNGVSAYGVDSLHYAANYEFGYRVRDYHTGNDFGHHEEKDGEKTNGHYHVLLPDGRMQKVKYSAGPEGFHADISYDHLQ